MLELPQPPSLIDFKAAVLGLPPVERLLADPVPAAELGRLAARLGLFQDPDDLLFGEPFPTQRGALPVGILSRILTRLVAEFSGSTSPDMSPTKDGRGAPDGLGVGCDRTSAPGTDCPAARPVAAAGR